MTSAPLILASTSPYRRDLLARLRLPFDAVPPGVDENVLTGEGAIERARRLAIEKATAVARLHPDALVIGSDQVVECAGRLMDKPRRAAVAREQLGFCGGRDVHFHTAVALLRAPDAGEQARVVTVSARFRALTAEEIDAYLALDEPFDCAGSIRTESLGLSLLESLDCPDPAALVGLPLIALCDMLRAAGVPLPLAALSAGASRTPASP